MTATKPTAQSSEISIDDESELAPSLKYPTRSSNSFFDILSTALPKPKTHQNR